MLLLHREKICVTTVAQLGFVTSLASALATQTGSAAADALGVVNLIGTVLSDLNEADSALDGLSPNMVGFGSHLVHVRVAIVLPPGPATS